MCTGGRLSAVQSATDSSLFDLTDHLPQEAMEALLELATGGTPADLEEVYNTERHLLYVACTRARDFPWVSGVEPASEFLDDLENT